MTDTDAKTPEATPRTQPEPFSWRYLAGALAIVALIVGGIGLMMNFEQARRAEASANEVDEFAAGLGLDTTDDAYDVPVAQTVTYEVKGSAYGANITYETESGTAQEQDVGVPLETVSGDEGITVTLPSGDFAYISAQNTDEDGSLTCSIVVDGLVIASTTSHGAYSIAQCDAMVP